MPLDNSRKLLRKLSYYERLTGVQSKLLCFCRPFGNPYLVDFYLYLSGCNRQHCRYKNQTHHVLNVHFELPIKFSILSINNRSIMEASIMEGTMLQYGAVHVFQNFLIIY